MMGRGFFAALALSLAGTLSASSTATAAEPIPSPDMLRERVQILTEPALAGRGSGTAAAAAAADTLASWMAHHGLEPAFDGSWFQSVPLTGQGWAGEDLTGKTGRNVAGVLPGRGTLAGRFIVVGAHYDHLGRVDPSSAEQGPPAKGAYYPGANDNASGVALVHELIRLAAVSSVDGPAARRSGRAGGGAQRVPAAYAHAMGRSQRGRGGGSKGPTHGARHGPGTWHGHRHMRICLGIGIGKRQ